MNNLRICLHGIIGGRSGKNGAGGALSIEKLKEHFYERVVKPNQKNFNVSVYIHSWSHEHKDEINTLYKADRTTIEAPKFQVKQRSKLYSLKESILMTKTDVIEGDLILSCRFDMFYKKDLDVKLLYEETNTKDKVNTILVPGDDLTWKGQSLCSIRVQDQFFVGSAKTLYPFFEKSNYERVDSNIKNKDYLIKSPANREHGRKMDNHRVFRNIFENERMFEKIIGNLGVSNIKSIMNEVHRDNQKLNDTLHGDIKLVKSLSMLAERDFFNARRYMIFHG